MKIADRRATVRPGELFVTQSEYLPLRIPAQALNKQAWQQMALRILATSENKRLHDNSRRNANSAKFPSLQDNLFVHFRFIGERRWIGVIRGLLVNRTLRRRAISG